MAQSTEASLGCEPPGLEVMVTQEEEQVPGLLLANVTAKWVRVHLEQEQRVPQGQAHPVSILLLLGLPQGTKQFRGPLYWGLRSALKWLFTW